MTFFVQAKYSIRQLQCALICDYIRYIELCFGIICIGTADIDKQATHNMCLESSRPKGQRSSGSRCPQTMIPHRCGIQFGHRRPPSYLHIPRLLIFLILSPHQPLPFSSLFLASVCVVHNSALSSCPLFILFKCLLSSTQTQFRLICCVKLIKCPHSETTWGRTFIFAHLAFN